MELVPLDLVRDESRDEIVDVRRGRDENGERVLAIVVPAAPPGGRFDRLPGMDVGVEHGPKALRALTHDDMPAAADRIREPADRVEQSTHVDLRLGGQRVQHRAHAQVGLHKRLDLDLARALQHGRVGAHVELHRVLAGPARAGR
jgi:hypothetical protein